MTTIKTKVWLSLAAIFAAGALAVNAIWVYSYNEIDRRHVAQVDDLTDRYAARVESLERSHKRQMGKMRNRVEKKVDTILEKLDKFPPSPVIIDVRKAIEESKNE